MKLYHTDMDGTKEVCVFESSGPTVSRREAIRVGLAAAALLALSGCNTFRKSGTPLDQAYQNLKDTLDGVADGDAQEANLAAIARRIENRCRELTQEHDEFRKNLDTLTRNLSTSDSELEAFVDTFKLYRQAQRDGLVLLQDELRQELTEEEWDKAIEALNQTQEAYTRPKIGETS